MSEQVQATGPARVANDEVWGITKLVFGASALVFLVTITLGFLNVFTSGALPRWQLLMHLHSATLGWLTLSVFGATVWLFTGERAVSDGYVDRVRWLGLAMIAAFVGLVASFGIAFSQGGDAFYLLAVFAPLAALTIWAAAAFFVHQLTRLPVVTTAHLLMASGFLVLAIAVVFGTIMAVGRAGILPIPSFASTVHVFGILGYQALVVTGIIEWLVVRERGSWTRTGALQVALGVLLGSWVPLVLVLLVAGLPEGWAQYSSFSESTSRCCCSDSFSSAGLGSRQFVQTPSLPASMRGFSSPRSGSPLGFSRFHSGSCWTTRPGGWCSTHTQRWSAS